MTTNRALVDRVAYLKEMYGIGSSQALRHIRIERMYETLRADVEMLVPKILGPDSDIAVSLEDVIEACDVLCRGAEAVGPRFGLLKDMLDYHHLNLPSIFPKKVNDLARKTAKTLYETFAAVYVIEKENARKSGRKFNAFMHYVQSQKALSQVFGLEQPAGMKQDIDETDAAKFDSCWTDIRDVPFGQPDDVLFEVEEENMTAYARAALDGTLHTIENERKIALSYVRQKGTQLNAEERINYSKILLLSELREEVNEAGSSIVDLTPDKLVYRIRFDSGTQEQFEEWRKLTAQYKIRKLQYTLHAIEENREWIKKMLA